MIIKDDLVFDHLKRDIKLKVLCKKCTLISHVYRLKYSKIDRQPFNEGLKCDSCKLVIYSFYSENNLANQLYGLNTIINLPQRTVFIHVNNSLLNVYEYNQSFLADIYKSKNVLIVGCGSIKRMVVLQTIRKLKLNKLVCLARNEDWAAPFFDDWILAEHENLSHKETTLRKVEQYMQSNNVSFDAILTYDDYCILMTSYLANHFGFPSIPYEVCARIKNKHEFRRVSTDLNISAPKFLMIDSNKCSEIKDAIQNNSIKQLIAENGGMVLNFPVIAKNTVGAGKDFVQKCNSIEDLARSIENSLAVSNKMDLLVEEFFDGNYLNDTLYLPFN
jgi:hypothetical protein